jgi:2-polyprenyl-6-methoxyphenol hydroxylase-like FAD-dependent oxidoreductase
MANTSPILIVGAGTTGLALACELARHGAPVRIIDKQSGINPHCRACSVHARTLEIFHDFGIIDEILAQGHKVLGMSQYANGERFMHSSGGEIDSPFPYSVNLEQCKTESALERLLHTYQLEVERETELVATFSRPDAVSATIRHGDGREEVVETPWLIGCDGAHSRVRHLNHIHFPGKEDPHQYCLADVLMDSALARDEIHFFMSDRGLLFYFPLPNGRWLISADLPKQHDAAKEQPSLEDVRAIASERGPAGIRISDPRWLAYFRINYRAARHYRHERIFLAGDAVHIHSPMGGQGMNTGIQDAYNLAWKLALVHRGRAPAGLLDSYEQERRPVAEDVLTTTKMLTDRFEAFSSLSPKQRERLYLNMVVPPEVAKRMARHLEQLDLSYVKSPICHQHEGSHFGKTRFAAGPRPGEEAIDAKPLLHENRPTTLFELLRGPKHTLLLFPGADHEAKSWHRLAELAQSVESSLNDLINIYFVAIEAGGAVPSSPESHARLILDPERSLHYRYGAETECLYLIRPDGHVGYRSEPAAAGALHDYLERIFTSG